MNKYRILIWIIVILIATNLSVAVSYIYHRQQETATTEQAEENNEEAPGWRRTRFFRDQLNLSPEQVDVFRTLNRSFNRKAWKIQHQLAALRMEMVNEMGLKEADKQELDEIAIRIGNLHEELKKETIAYYLAMKEACTTEQQEKLHQLFLSILSENEDVQLPHEGGRFRNSRRAIEER